MTLWLTAIAALMSAVVGGIFFAFSSFVMPALGRIPPSEGLRAMQRINIDVLHWSFFLAFFGTAILCLVLVAHAGWGWGEAGAGYRALGGSLYLGGCLLVTVMGNVPLNNAIAKVDADSPNAVLEWQRYGIVWVRWNHVRTAACVAAAGAFLAALATG